MLGTFGSCLDASATTMLCPGRHKITFCLRGAAESLVDLPCGADTLHARTLVGIRPGGQELFVVTAQGQTPDKPADLGGLTLRQAQGLMRSLGAYDAAMFDGGGSTLLTARIGKSYKMVSRPTGNVRPIPNNIAFWPR